SYRVYRVQISTINARALKDSGLTAVQIDRCKNMFALGLTFWMYSRPLETTLHWIDDKFGKNPAVAEANKTALKAGYHYGETTEMFATHYHVPKAKQKPGLYRNITGNEATALGFVTASKLAGRPLFYGSNGESPVAIVAPATSADCFDMAIEAWRIAIKYRTPVIFLSDGYLGMGSEPWLVPDVEKLPKIPVEFASDAKTFEPYARDPETLARPWAIPGTPDLEHRIGGLEKADITGNVSYDAANHDKMVKFRADKTERIANDIPEVEPWGEESGGLLVLGWGSTYGPALSAVQRARARGLSVSHAHLRYLNPFPANLGDVLSRFDRVLIPEMNLGQLLMLIRARSLVRPGGQHQHAAR